MRPADAKLLLVLAHGAGAGMRHAFMTAIAEAAVRAVWHAAARLVPDLPRFAGGKSFGGRMTSQAQSQSPLAGVAGLVFLGFPLHPAGRPGDERGEHLARVACPMLFVQGSRDELADVALVTALVDRLGPRATLAMFDDADHGFHVRARSGSNDAEVLEHLLDTVVAWMGRVGAPRSTSESC